MIQRLTHPSYCHPKTYLAQVEGKLTKEAITKLNNELGSLNPGEWQFLSNAEISQLKKELVFG